MGQGSRRKLELPKDQESSERNVSWTSLSSPRPVPLSTVSFLVAAAEQPSIRSCRRRRNDFWNRARLNCIEFMTWRVYCHWFTRSLIPMFPFVSRAMRFERPDDDFTRWIPHPLFLFLSVSLCRLSVDDGRILSTKFATEAQPSQPSPRLLRFHSMGTRVITGFQLLFPVLDKFPATDAPVNKFE